MEITLIDEISFALSIPKRSIEEYGGFAKKPRNFYRIARIPKKSKQKGYRTIFLPSAEIKQIQHFITQRYLSKLPVSNSARAYICGKCVVDNAVSHRTNHHFLLLDIKHFFDSIDFSIFKSIVIKNNLFVSLLDAELALNLCSYEKRFVQGCVSSPTIANAYMYDFDNNMERLASELPCGVYTRYSDDLVFSSSQRIPKSLIDFIDLELKKLNLSINHKKTHFFSNIERVKLTGIRIKNDRTIGLDTRFKKELKNNIYSFVKMAKKGQANHQQKSFIQGKLAYLKMADPSYFNVIEIKYGVNGLLLSEFIKAYKPRITENIELLIK